MLWGGGGGDDDDGDAVGDSTLEQGQGQGQGQDENENENENEDSPSQITQTPFTQLPGLHPSIMLALPKAPLLLRLLAQVTNKISSVEQPPSYIGDVLKVTVGLLTGAVASMDGDDGAGVFPLAVALLKAAEKAASLIDECLTHVEILISAATGGASTASGSNRGNNCSLSDLNELKKSLALNLFCTKKLISERADMVLRCGWRAEGNISCSGGDMDTGMGSGRGAGQGQGHARRDDSQMSATNFTNYTQEAAILASLPAPTTKIRKYNQHDLGEVLRICIKWSVRGISSVGDFVEESETGVMYSFIEELEGLESESCMGQGRDSPSGSPIAGKGKGKVGGKDVSMGRGKSKEVSKGKSTRSVNILTHPDYHTLSLQSFPIYFTTLFTVIRERWVELMRTTTTAGGGQVTVTTMSSLVTFFNHLVQITKCSAIVNRKETLLAIALKEGRKFVEGFIKSFRVISELFDIFYSDILNCIKVLQKATRQLQHICNHFKDRSDPKTSRDVPAIKRVLELLLYKAKALLAEHQKLGYFESASLKKRRIDGQVLLDKRLELSDSEGEEIDQYDDEGDGNGVSTCSEEEEEEEAEGEGSDLEIVADDDRERLRERWRQEMAVPGHTPRSTPGRGSSSSSSSKSRIRGQGQGRGLSDRVGGKRPRHIQEEEEEEEQGDNCGDDDDNDDDDNDDDDDNNDDDDDDDDNDDGESNDDGKEKENNARLVNRTNGNGNGKSRGKKRIIADSDNDEQDQGQQEEDEDDDKTPDEERVGTAAGLWSSSRKHQRSNPSSSSKGSSSGDMREVIDSEAY